MSKQFGKRRFVRPKDGKIGRFSRKFVEESKYHPRTIRQFLGDAKFEQFVPQERDYTELLEQLV